jgi:sulfite reductase (ferredoxin)
MESLEPKLKIRLFKRHNRFRKKIALFDGKLMTSVFVAFSTRRLRAASGRRTNDSYQIAFGKVTSEQLVRITKVSDEYSTGRLHYCQDIKFIYVV